MVVQPPSDYYTQEDGDVQKGRMSTAAFRLAPKLKSKFVARAPTSGGSVGYDVLKPWLLNQLEAQREE